MKGIHWYLAAVCLALPVGCGSPTTQPALVAGTDNAEAPESVTVVCSRDGSYAVGTMVEPSSDGAHFTIDNRGDFKEYLIRRPGAESSHGGRLQPGTNEVLDPIGPGEIWIQCYDAPGDASYRKDRSPSEVAIEVIDSKGIYQPYNLQCDGAEPEGGGHFEGFEQSDDVDQWIRATIPGLSDTDVILRPGYPETQWKAEFRVIQRDDRRVALVQMWGIDVKRCPGIDIGN